MAKFKIAIFAGHSHDTWETTGGKGVTTDLIIDSDYEEYDSNIIIAKETVRLLEKYDDIEVLFPQANDKKMGLFDRAKYCNNNNVDTAMFIHSNASSSKSASGSAAFYWHSSEKGKEFAEHYRDEMKAMGYPLWSDGTYPCQESGWSNFYVVENTYMPVVLTENFFFTNPEELEKYLLNEDELKKIAIVHEKSALKYLGVDYKDELKVEKKVKKDAKEVEKAKHVSKPVKKSKSNYRRTLINKSPKFLMKGADVAEAQKAIGAKVDRMFGNVSEAKTKEFQKEQGLVSDGVIGQKTWVAIDNPTKIKSKLTLPKSVLKEGDRGNDVKQVQKALNSINFNVASEDGVFGSKTADGV
ncbi:MAG: N-acetylmuramoyl-L-alanine amidase, partial [Candidatus Paceibacterota bacterium]